MQLLQIKSRAVHGSCPQRGPPRCEDSSFPRCSLRPACSRDILRPSAQDTERPEKRRGRGRSQETWPEPLVSASRRLVQRTSLVAEGVGSRCVPQLPRPVAHGTACPSVRLPLSRLSRDRSHRRAARWALLRGFLQFRLEETLQTRCRTRAAVVGRDLTKRVTRNTSSCFQILPWQLGGASCTCAVIAAMASSADSAGEQPLRMWTVCAGRGT